MTRSNCTILLELGACYRVTSDIKEDLGRMVTIVPSGSICTLSGLVLNPSLGYEVGLTFDDGNIEYISKDLFSSHLVYVSNHSSKGFICRPLKESHCP